MSGLRPESEPKMQEFNFEVVCGLCNQAINIPIQDTNVNDAKANAVQTAVLVHVCPTGSPGVSDFRIK